MEEKKEKGDHIGQGYMKLCVNNNDDIVILKDLELEATTANLTLSCLCVFSVFLIQWKQ